jgi:hypothetical protein
MRRTDFISAVTLLALALAVLLEASKLPFGRVGSPQAGFFPLILAAFLAIFSLVFLAQAIGAHKVERRLPRRINNVEQNCPRRRRANCVRPPVRKLRLYH